MVVSRILNGFFVLYGIPRNVTFKYLKNLANANGFELKRPTSIHIRGGEVNVLESLLQIITLFVAHLLYDKTLNAHVHGTARHYKNQRQKVVLHHSPLLLVDSLREPVLSLPPLPPEPLPSALPPEPLPSAVPSEPLPLPSEPLLPRPGLASLFPIAVATEESEDEGESEEAEEEDPDDTDATILKTVVGSVVQVVNNISANQENTGLLHREEVVNSLHGKAQPEISRVAVMIARLERNKLILQDRQRVEIQQGSGSRSRTILGGNKKAHHRKRHKAGK
jgi:hypothetical protein